MSLLDNSLFQAAVVSPVVGGVVAWFVGGRTAVHNNGHSISQNGNNNSANIGSNNTTNHHHHYNRGHGEGDDFGSFLIILVVGALIVASAATYGYVAYLPVLKKAVLFAAIASSSFSLILELRWCLIGKTSWLRLAFFGCLAVGMVLFSLNYSGLMMHDDYIPYINVAQDEGMWKLWGTLSSEWKKWFGFQIFGFVMLLSALIVQVSVIHMRGNKGPMVGVGVLLAIISIAHLSVTGEVYHWTELSE